jgi:hypothetical protein
MGREGAAPGPVLLLASVLWAGLLVAASLVVRALREAARGAGPAGAAPQPLPAPVGPAVAAAAVVLALAGDLVAPGAQAQASLLQVAAALAGAGLLLAGLLPHRAAPVRGCRSGLFDCAWPVPAPQAWRLPAGWPRQAAMLGMLPMMCSLGLMVDLCTADLGWSPRQTVAAHLLAMLGPAALLRLRSQGLGRTSQPTLLAGLLLAGALAGAAWPGVRGWMLASLLQAAAWSLAWAAPMLAPRPLRQPQAAAPTPPTGGPGFTSAAATAALALALGLAAAAWGAVALLLVQAMLAGVATLGWLLAHWQAWRRERAAPVRLS